MSGAVRDLALGGLRFENLVLREFLGLSKGLVLQLVINHACISLSVHSINWS